VIECMGGRLLNDVVGEAGSIMTVVIGVTCSL